VARQVLTRELDRNLHGAEFSTAGDCVHAILTDRGCAHLCAIGLAGDTEETVTLLIGGEVGVSSWRTVGDTTVALLAAAEHPPELFVLEVRPFALHPSAKALAVRR
jgi:hypothetical protein